MYYLYQCIFIVIVYNHCKYNQSKGQLTFYTGFLFFLLGGLNEDILKLRLVFPGEIKTGLFSIALVIFLQCYWCTILETWELQVTAGESLIPVGFSRAPPAPPCSRARAPRCPPPGDSRQTHSPAPLSLGEVSFKCPLCTNTMFLYAFLPFSFLDTCFPIC